MAEENEPIEIAPKVTGYYSVTFFVVLLLGLIAVGILFRTFDTALWRRRMGEGGRKPETPEPSDITPDVETSILPMES